MKKKMVFGVLLTFLAVLGYGSVAMSGGIEPSPGDDEDCKCIPTLSAEQIKQLTKKGPTLRGVFTVSNEPCSFNSDCTKGNFVVHLSLRWENKLHLTAFRTTNGGACSPCSIDGDTIKGLVRDLPCFLQLEKPFGLVGTPLIRGLMITNENCDGDPNRHILMGEIIIAVVPTLKCDKKGN